jgi:hypothetical protein
MPGNVLGSTQVRHTRGASPLGSRVVEISGKGKGGDISEGVDKISSLAQRFEPMDEFLIAGLGRQGYGDIPKDFRRRKATEDIWGHISRNNRPTFDDRPLADRYPGKDQAMGSDVNFVLDDDSFMFILLLRPPVEMGEYGRPETDGAKIADFNRLGVQFIEINVLPDKYTLSNFHPSRALQHYSEGITTRGQESDFIDNPAEKAVHSLRLLIPALVTQLHGCIVIQEVAPLLLPKSSASYSVDRM